MLQKFAVIGLGNIAQRHRKNLKKLFPKSDVIAMSSRELPSVTKVDNADKIAGSLAELISLKPQFVIVASATSFHFNHAVGLIKAKIPVLIEKPIAADSTNKKQLALEVYQSGVNVAVGYCLRYLPSAQFMCSLLHKSLLGQIYNISINVGQFLPDWRPNQNYRDSVSSSQVLGGGVLLELSHELDYLQWLFGDFKLEYAQLRNTRQLDLEVEEIADLVLVNQQGVVCNVHLDFLQKIPQRRCSIIAENGRLDWDLISNKVDLYTASGKETLFEAPHWESNNMYLDMLRDFSASIQGKKNQCISVDEAMNTVELIENIKRKAIWGKKQ